MKRSTWRRLSAAVSVAAAGAITITLASAHGGATGVVKQRMDLMSRIGDATKELSAMFKGTVPYDPDAVRQAANVLEAHSGDALIKLFPEDSIMAPSEALPSIWRDWEEFERLSRRLKTLSAGLAGAADNAPGASGTRPARGSGASMMTTRRRSMMGGGMMGGSRSAERRPPSIEALSAMPASAVFGMVAETCSSCHGKFRQKKK